MILSARDRRAAAFGLLLGGPILLWLTVVRPWWGKEVAAREALAREVGLLARERVIVAERGEIPRLETEAQAEWAKQSGTLLAGATPGEAFAALGSRVQAAGKSHQVLVSVIEPLPAAPVAGALLPVGLRLRGEGDYAGILRFLAALEGAQPRIRVESVRLTARGQLGGAREALTVEATVTGLWAAADAAP